MWTQLWMHVHGYMEEIATTWVYIKLHWDQIDIKFIPYACSSLDLEKITVGDDSATLVVMDNLKGQVIKSIIDVLHAST